ncbi:carboxypeptidase-like regulatory domain-containing protein [Geomonas sp. Red32]|uniref:beta strand repeat-containing protein n=1 Tax=Geomonas sp. Red32 TaxID=2912856 RepID=UPI00202CA7B5|nr:carboxypeptidase regulatory-like domain-containing protein [Geomonas sp. Red32]MCM0083753.1 carboxypeptidase-like regulatory domain-containing protein [Geomonas sp. Red32]
MLKEFVRQFFRQGTRLATMAASLLALMGFFGGSALAATGIPSVTTTHWKSGSTQGYTVTGKVTIPDNLAPATITMTSTALGIPANTPLVGESSGTVYTATVDVANRPGTGAQCTFNVTYVDNTTETLTATVSTVSDNFPVPTAPLGAVGSSANPAFTWTAPTTAPAGGYDIAINGSDIVWTDDIAPGVTTYTYNNPTQVGGYAAAVTPGVLYSWNVASVDAVGNRAEVRNNSFMTGVNFTGKVTDMTGAPVAGVTVSAIDSQGVTRGVSVTTLADGTYMYGGLASGTYTVLFNTNSQLVYYNNQITAPDPLAVTAGTIVSNINAEFGSWGIIKGNFYLSGTGPAPVPVTVGLYTAAKVAVSGISPVTVTPAVRYASYEFTLVPPGSYYLKFSAAGYADVWSAATVPVTAGFVTDDTVNANVDATLVPVPDTTAPTVTVFTPASASTTLNIPISTFTASDNAGGTGVAGYLVTETSTAPTSGWLSSAPSSYTVTQSVPEGVATNVTLYAWAKDGAGNVSAYKSAVVRITLSGPLLTISGSTLADGTATKNPNFTLSGTATPNASAVTGVSVALNGGTAKSIAFDSTTGVFSTGLVLAVGSNTIVTTAADAHGSTTDQRVITYNPALTDLTISSPADGSYTKSNNVSLNGTFAAQGTATITVKVNGVAVTPVVSGSSFSATVFLNQGANAIVVSATDSATGTTTKALSVTYDGSVPDLTVTSPAATQAVLADPSTQNSSVVLAGVIGDVTNNPTLAYTVNGGAPTAVTVAGNGTFSTSLSLANGASYVIKVTATDPNSLATTTVQRNVVVTYPTGCLTNGISPPSLADAQQLIKFALGVNTASTQDKGYADVAPLVGGKPQPDGIIGVGDVLVILERLVGLKTW